MKKLVAVFLAVMLAFSSSGCWDAVDINDRDVITAVVVDKTEYGYSFAAEVQSITGGSNQKEGESQQQKSTILTSEGRTVAEAREEMDRRSDKPIFLGAVQSVILTDKLASFGIEEYMLRLRQLNEYRKTVHVVVTTDDPQKFLDVKSENAPSVGFAVDTTIMSLANLGRIQNVSLMDVLEALASPYPHYILPTIATVRDELTFTGYTVFSGGMKTGFVPAADCRGIVLMLAKHPRFEYTVPYRDMYTTLEITLDRRKVIPEYKDGIPCFKVQLKLKTEMLYPEKMKPITDSDLELIRSTLKAMIEQDISYTFLRSQQEYKYDFFNLHDAFRIAYPEEYKRMNWADEYQKSKIFLSVDAKIAVSPLIDYNPEKR